ncbi:MAG: TIGR01906 family membrane protein [Floccifex porci]|uniref:TIGR01906 family membrane protein n=1 Tax=Floccifex porci TaxID=2606629 RepID=UPI002A7FBC1F|nr:TIGR01906 family membrane protein [Floccifex porci]MDY4797656.1 TIGR01906 family membrane protein [Floccifex porci]
MKSFLAYLFNICLIIICVVSGIKSIALDPSFYEKRYEKYDFYDTLHVSSEDLNQSIHVLLDYIEDNRDDIVVYIDEQEVFNDREKAHMVDVKNLYQKSLKVMYVSIGAAMGILFYFLLFEKRYLSFLTRGFLRVLYTVLMLLSFFGIWIFTDFTSFWNWLHTLLFTNDLWLLDPRTSFMINMLPEIIFNQLVFAIVFYLILFIVPLTIFSIYYQIKKAPIGFENS